MPIRLIKLLHVEDENSERRLLAHHLARMDDLRFQTLYANAEDVALDVFDDGGVEFVILDYHLQRGNGLNCLKELRRRDHVVPIVAISGVATDEIAADLLQGGADDYLCKRDLTSGMLANSIRDALRRADVWRWWETGHRHKRHAGQ